MCMPVSPHQGCSLNTVGGQPLRWGQWTPGIPAVSGQLTHSCSIPDPAILEYCKAWGFPPVFSISI
jgi:hypothetical protein